MHDDILCCGDSWKQFFNLFNRASKSRVPDGEFPLRQNAPMTWTEMKSKEIEGEREEERDSHTSSVSLLFTLSRLCCSQRWSPQHREATKQQQSDNWGQNISIYK